MARPLNRSVRQQPAALRGVSGKIAIEIAAGRALRAIDPGSRSSRTPAATLDYFQFALSEKTRAGRSEMGRVPGAVNTNNNQSGINYCFVSIRVRPCLAGNGAGY